MKVFKLFGAVALVLGITVSASSFQQSNDQSSHAGHAHAASNTPQGEALGTSDFTPEFVRGDIIYGNEDAPVQIIEYASLTCPACRAFMKEVVLDLKEEYIPSGKVRLMFRNFVLNQLDLAVSVASRCTNNMDTSKALHEMYFEKQMAWASANDPKAAIYAIAEANGVSEDQLRTCLQSREMFEHVIGIAKGGHDKYQIQSTPTVIMNGEKVEFSSYQDMRDKIRAAVEAE